MKYDFTRPPLKAGDTVTLKALALDHVVRRLEKTSLKQDAAKVLGISVRTITRWLEEFEAAYLKYPRGARDRGRTQSDHSETGTDD